MTLDDGVKETVPPRIIVFPSNPPFSPGPGGMRLRGMMNDLSSIRSITHLNRGGLCVVRFFVLLFIGKKYGDCGYRPRPRPGGGTGVQDPPPGSD